MDQTTRDDESRESKSMRKPIVDFVFGGLVAILPPRVVCWRMEEVARTNQGKSGCADGWLVGHSRLFLIQLWSEQTTRSWASSFFPLTTRREHRRHEAHPSRRRNIQHLCKFTVKRLFLFPPCPLPLWQFPRLPPVLPSQASFSSISPPACEHTRKFGGTS